MIRITSIRRCKISEYDDIYLIIRSVASLERSGSSVLQHAKQLADLSPSKELFYSYLDWKKNNEWNQDKFNECYKPTFINELNANPNAAKWLNKIEENDKAGRKIALLCFCPDENLCHRIIIGDILRSRGCNVVFDRDAECGIK